MQTVPDFPDFRHFTLDDKDWYETFYSNFPAYADFSFGNLMIWQGQEGNLQVSKLNENIVFLDKPQYLGGEIMLNFLGDKKVDETILALFEYQKEHGIEQALRGVPAFIVKKISDKDIVEISEDIDNAEYILDVEKLAKLDGHDMQSVRRYANKFKKATNDDYRVIASDVHDTVTHMHLTEALDKWDKAFATNDTAAQERPVMQRMFTLSKELGYKSAGVYAENQLTAFIVYRVLNDDTVLLNHHKTNYKYPGLSVALIHEAAKVLYEKGFKYINYEQDLGIEGLRLFKQKMKPVDMLKKYTLKPQN
jgi:hypothetical protein